MKPWLLAIFLCACGPKSKGLQPPLPASHDAGVTATPAPTEEDVLSETDCVALFEHMFQIAVTKQQESLPEEERPTPADVAKAKTKMRSNMLIECTGASRTAVHYECAMAAVDRPALEACQAD